MLTTSSKIINKYNKIITISIIIMLSIALPIVSNADKSSHNDVNNLYPCSKCHSSLKVTGVTKWSTYHNKNLTEGAHGGLTCANCHDPDSYMMNLVNGVPLTVKGLHNESQLMSDNSLCGICHQREYEAYQVGAHGNTTYECQNGTYINVKGYKGVMYRLHLCDSYYNLTVKPAHPCVVCHNPHDPTYYAISILPPPSERVPRPDETNIAVGGVAVVVTGIALIYAGHLMASRSSGR